MERELYAQNPWWEEVYKEYSIDREIYLKQIISALDKKDIIFITGLRRIGKTTIIKQVIKHLLKNVLPKDILFVNMDSYNIIGKSIHEIIEKYREIHKKSIKDHFYLFLDEITSKEKFEIELKSLYDNENITIVCSSSVATLMRDKRALLTGRTKTIEVMPLTFQEFLLFRGVKIKRYDSAILRSHFKDYLMIGGIPRYALTKDKDYLQELIDGIIYKDIIAYHNITNEKVIKELFVLLCGRVGKALSYNKISKILKISVDSVKRYISYFEKSYLFYTIERFSRSYNKNFTSPKKIYIGDVGIKNMITGFGDLGSSFENLVFLKIKHLKPSYYLENLAEIDFITKDFLIEAKYGQDLKDKQKIIFESIKSKEKIVAKGVEFFDEDIK